MLVLTLDFSSFIGSNFILKMVGANYQSVGFVMPCMTHLIRILIKYVRSLIK